MPLTVHFLNVGHGDCTIIEHPSGHLSVVDLNNGMELDILSRAEIGAEYRVGFSLLTILNRQALRECGYQVELTNPVEFLVRRYPRHGIMRYIQTHPDMDHMRGLSALINAGLIPTNFWDTAHNKEPELQESDIDDWEAYLAFRNGYFPKTTVLRLTRGVANKYYNRDAYGNLGGDGIEILSPSQGLQKWANENEQWNELSYVIRVSHGGRSMILGGDAGEVAWADIFAHYGNALKCQVLKASHHGRDTGYYQPAVKAMSPAITVVSVGKKPSTDVSDAYRRNSENVWSTRWKGNISIIFPDDVSQPIIYDWEYDR